MAHAPAELVSDPGRGRWSDLLTRLASAAVLAPVALLALWYGGIAWAILVGIAMLGLGIEWSRLCGLNIVSLLPVLAVLPWEFALFFNFWAGFAVLLGVTLYAAWRFGRRAAAGMPYIGIGGLALLWLRLAPVNGLRATLFLLAVVWATDIGAYLVGRVAGGARMAPSISPGKTWSGAAGGLVFAGAAGLFLADLRPAALAVALVLSVFAQAGDLLESAIKRRLGVKDSGRTIPGHGGLFDRLDGFLAAAPLAALWVLAAPEGLNLWH